jgi:hypothetical protein
MFYRFSDIFKKIVPEIPERDQCDILQIHSKNKCQINLNPAT